MRTAAVISASPARPRTLGRVFPVVLVLFALVAFAACEDEIEAGDIAVQMPGDDAVVTSHSAGPLDLSIRRPGAISRGVARFEVTVREDGAAVDDLDISATSDMSAMDHEQDIPPTNIGSGVYGFDVPFGMPGDWALSFVIDDDRYGELPPVTVEFEVPAVSE